MSKILLLALILLSSQISLAQYGINIQEISDFDDLDEIVLEKKVIDDDLLKDIEEIKKKKNFLENKFGPINTKVKYNPLSSQKALALNLDVIETYYILKNKPQGISYIPYSLKYMKKDFENNYDIKGSALKAKHHASDYYKKLKHQRAKTYNAKPIN